VTTITNTKGRWGGVDIEVEPASGFESDWVGVWCTLHSYDRNNPQSAKLKTLTSVVAHGYSLSDLWAGGGVLGSGTVR
jgi:hypothetical protein